MTFNKPVTTPYGDGIFQGIFAVMKPGTTETETTLALVRLPINKITEPHLGSAVTRHAKVSGLWAFEAHEVVAVQS